MKKLLSVILMIAMLVTFTVAGVQATEYTQSKYSVYLDGAYTKVNNITAEGTEYLPVKELCGILGYNIEEISDNTYEITEGENCKNSESTIGKAEFTVGEDFS